MTVGSVMESSKIPLQKWVLAFHLMCSSKKGISALQLQRELELGSYRTAWFMCHRIRHAMAGDESQEQLKGAVEADETYVGGKTKGGKRGRGANKKTPVMALVARDGGIRVKPIERVNKKTLHGEILKNVSPQSIILTDDWSSYRGIGKHFEGGHETVNHSAKEYARIHPESGLPINTNTVESFFCLIKRGHYGVFHQLSKKHLHRYCDEFGFRWEYRKVSDAVRRNEAIRRAEGKRLMYREPTDR
ncbi:MAG: IS1595 family transposase [Planctomycetaceae bacterium]